VRHAGKGTCVKRRLLNLLTALSLLLCMAVVALWVRGYRVGNYGEFVGVLDVRAGDPVEVMRNLGMYSSHGRLGLGVTRSDFPPNDPYRTHHPHGRRLVWGTDDCFERFPFGPPRANFRPWFAIDARDRTWANSTAVPGGVATTTSRGVAISCWVPAGLFAILPTVVVLRHWRARRRRRTQCCLTCGYDLRATPGRCPECGTVTGAADSPDVSPAA
jgi:hypothetical protein